MHSNAPDIVRVSFKHVHPLQCVVVEDSDGHVIRPGDDPILAWHKLCGSDWQITNLGRVNLSVNET